MAICSAGSASTSRDAPRQPVFRAQHYSAFKNFDKRTPQGGILSHLFFNLFVENPVCFQTCPHVQVLSYANDIAIVATGPNHVARAMLRRLLTWSDLGLLPYSVKTKAMAFGYVHLPRTPPSGFFLIRPFGRSASACERRLSFAASPNGLCSLVLATWRPYCVVRNQGSSWRE